MFRNYFKTAFRNLRKYKFISFINLFGLTLGLTCCLLILTYILNELSYDRYNVNADRIYRVIRNFNNQDGTLSLRLSTISPPFGPLLKNEFPDIEKITRLLPNGTTPMRYEDKVFNEKNVYFADENLFDVFTVKTIHGNPKTALNDPFTVMLTDEVAKKYFGNADPMDKSIKLNGQFNCKVTGIFAPFPSNSYAHPDILISFNTLRDTLVYGEENLRTNWGNNSFFTFLLMPKNYPVEKMKARFPAFLDKSMPPNYYTGGNPSKFTSLDLQKLTDIHLYSHTDYEAEANGDITRVYIFSAIALFILLIACINYMNLSTARSALRAREIGIRKVVGAEKNELVFQFLSESVLISWVAIIFAVIFTWFLLPLINKMSGQQLQLENLLQPRILIPLFITPFVVGVISGIYPALFMSAFQPVKTLKGLFKTGGGSISFRKVLVVSQFAISIILIITTAIVFRQLQYMQQISLGYDKDRVINLLYSPEVDKQYNAFRTDLLQNTAVKEVARSSRIPTGRLLDDMGAATLVGDSMRPLNTDIKMVSTDYDFLPTFNIPLAAGRNFSREFKTDTAGYILNETAIKMIGWKTAQNSVGKDFQYGGIKGHVIGVMKDFHFESLHQQIVPMVLLMPSPSRAYFNNISIKLGGGNILSDLNYVEKKWKNYFPETPFDYSFLDQQYDKLYQSEQKQAAIFTLFSFIAIFIACLGLFGLSAFSITQRIKEIGVRKVLGASVGSIVTLLSKDFLKLVAIAALIAFPVAWWAMHNWLKDFAYRINIEWWVFVSAAIVAALIALITISFQAIRAGLSNPVKSLRTE